MHKKIMVLGSHAQSLINFRYDMLRSMALHNQVVACAPMPADPQEAEQVISKLQAINVQFCSVDLARTGLNPIADGKSLWHLYRLCKKIRPDILLSYTSKPVIYGSIAAKLAGVPKRYSMITGVGSYFIHNDFKSKVVRCIMSLLYKASLLVNTKVFFQNPDDVKDFARMRIFKDFTRTVFINGSGVNVQHYQPHELPSVPSFLMISRFIKAKGIIEYLEAARLLKKKYPQARCLLVGWFEDKDEGLAPAQLQSYIDDNSVEYLGKLDDVRPALQQASVYVLPSYREGTPKSVLEAMACGLAIITTDVPGCRETVQDNGLLVAAQDAQALYLAMERFILEPELISLMGKRSRIIAEARFAVDKVNAVILKTMGLKHV